jgi:hypothetical protein
MKDTNDFKARAMGCDHSIRRLKETPWSGLRGLLKYNATILPVLEFSDFQLQLRTATRGSPLKYYDTNLWLCVHMLYRLLHSYLDIYVTVINQLN